MDKSTAPLTSRTITQMGLFLALIIVSGMFALPVPGLGVPVVLQNMVIMLAGGLLGKKVGLLTNGLFLLLAFAGLPLLAGGRGGAAVFLSPSSGFLLGYLVCVPVISSLSGWLGTQHFWQLFIVYVIGGALCINFFGSFSLAYYSHLSWANGLKMAAAFVPLDMVKAALAAWLQLRLQGILHFETK